MKYFILASILSIYHATTYALECPKQPSHSKNTMELYLNCEKSSPECLKLNDQDRKTINLIENSKFKLTITDAYVQEDVINITMDKNSSCWFEKITDENIGKKIAVVIKDTVVSNPTIYAKISTNIFQISPEKNSSTATTLELCKTIFAKCSERKKEVPPPRQDGLTDLSYLPSAKKFAELRNKYPQIKGSIMWVTEKDTIEIYDEKTFKKISNFNPPTISSGKDAGKKMFFASQEFDFEKKQFVTINDFIKLIGYGWVKRTDILPLSILRYNKAQSAKIYETDYASKKCPKEFMEQINLFVKANKDLTAKEMVNMKEMSARENYIVSCSIKSERECENDFAAIEAKVNKESCSKIFGK